ncbi:MAG: translation initiation factor IF-2 [Nitrospirae bacterium]|nr:translation initiation factor IF-2 [Nitrospirota bacterium]
MRIFELAKKLGLGSKELLVVVNELGIEVSNHMSAVDDADVRLISNKVSGKKEPPAKKDLPSGLLRKEKPKTTSASKAVPEEKPAEKKPRMLLKKKLKVEGPPADPELVALHTERDPSLAEISSGLELHKEGVQAETSISGKTASETSGGVAAPVKDKKDEPTSLTKPAVVSAAGIAAKPEEKAKKRTAEEELLLQQENLSKAKDKFKKVKKNKWEKDDAVLQIPSETRDWQDFKPIHKRDDRGKAGKKFAQPAAVIDITKPRKKVIKLTEGTTVKEFAELTGVKGTTVIAKLMEMGAMATLNQPMNLDAASLIAEGLGIKIEVVLEKTEEEKLERQQDSAESLQPRPPVVTIMGHVDHGKTSLLDAIRETKVTEGEAGGITQHIGAYVVEVGEKKICFLDTPGHEAFTAMRARGAKVTDIVVLVVAADDGVMPQTVEAINHAQAAGVPIIVAINKIDKPEANVEKIRNSLSEFQLISEAWGGQTIFVEVSAKKKIGLDTLLEMILLQAEVLELKADPNKLGRGTIIEAKLDKGRGPVATVLISEGKIQIGDVFVTGSYAGKIRALINDRGQNVKESGPSSPVEVIGLEGVPSAGDSFVIVKEEKMAREIASSRALKLRVSEMGQARKVTLDDLFNQIKEGDVKELRLVLKGDVQGSVEALRESLNKLTTPAVKIVVIHSGVGGITESDVLLASASNALIIGFNVTADTKGNQLAEKEKVDIRFYNIIYNAVADVKAAMEGLLEPTLKERSLGKAEVRQTFSVPKIGVIGGCYVIEGVIARSAIGVRLIRDGVVIYDGKLGSLRRFKDDVKDVQTGYECGIGIENYNDLKIGDIIEAYTIDKIAGKLL